ncbi:hypothetical protein M9H77_04159 [Catharanthus roseus]|uniref:Uncharacterized protein n=1 Tax=Catharanthus roseus TaxID=4058 RepID=A0ACC0CDS5_CATRO|nr:hypothetical protein M9H77_04159 [Catharanthus roseus]
MEYCKFHQDHGHDTEQCIELWKEIENAIRQGLLKDFIAQHADYQQEHKKKGDQEHHPPKNLSHRKRHRQEEHDALLVVTFDISHCTKISSSRMRLTKCASFQETSNLRQHQSLGSRVEAFVQWEI